MDLKLRQTADGVELTVKASPGSRQNEIRGIVDGALKISVTAIAEKGKANAAIIKFLSKQLRISKSRIRLSAGASSSLKRFLIREIELDLLKHKLNQLIAGGDETT